MQNQQLFLLLVHYRRVNCNFRIVRNECKYHKNNTFPDRSLFVVVDHFLHLEKALPTSWLCIYLITFHNLLYLHWTTRLFEILRGCSRAGCHTRQSSFFPFMLRRGCREKKLDTEPLSLVRFSICPGRSVSHETRGVGRPTARQEAAWRNDWPSFKTSASKEEMGKTKRRAGGTEGA